MSLHNYNTRTTIFLERCGLHYVVGNLTRAISDPNLIKIGSGFLNINLFFGLFDQKGDKFLKFF